MARKEYYTTKQQIYNLFKKHPALSNLYSIFSIDNDKIQLAANYVVDHETDIDDFPIYAYYNDSDIINDIANIYGYVTPPWSQYVSTNGTKLDELLNLTIYIYKFGTTDNYYEKNLINFIPEFDREKILEKPKMKLTVESLGRKLDEIEDYISRTKDLYDINNAPESVLDYLGQNIGYEKEDFTLSDVSFRELLNNIIEIYKIKGTNYSFSFFFKFLGFDISLKEFYYNKNVNNPQNFPGVDSEKVEYYLTTKNPIEDFGEPSNGFSFSPAKYLRNTKNLDDWDIEILSLQEHGCENYLEYITGKETFNNDGETWHSSPWEYFKTNLIEYQLTPFVNNTNLTASDNETIRKYVKFLSPTYLFTWINVNLRPWVDDINTLEDVNDDWRIQITKTIGDIRPTPTPWPPFPMGEMGVPIHPENILLEPEDRVWQTKTAEDLPGPYLDYDDIGKETEILTPYGQWIEVDYHDIIQTTLVVPTYGNLPHILSSGDIFYVINDNAYYGWNVIYTKFILTTDPEAPALSLGSVQTKLSLPTPLREYSVYFVVDIDKYYQFYNDIYNEIEYSDLITISEEVSSLINLPTNAIFGSLYKITDLNLYYKWVDKELTIQINNYMNFGGEDVLGTILKRDGAHIRKIGHPRHIADAKHNGNKKLSFDLLSLSLKDSSLPDEEENWLDYSYRPYPASPITVDPFNSKKIQDINTIVFSWDSVIGKTGYWIQIATDIFFNNVIIDTNTLIDNEYLPTELFHNDLYYWRLKVRNALPLDILDPLAWGPWSNVWNFTMIATPFPYNGELINKSTEYVFVDYILEETTTYFNACIFNMLTNKVIGAQLYEIELKKYISSSLIDEDTYIVTTNSKKLELTNGNYIWKWRSKDNFDVYSDWSEELSFTVNFALTI